MILMYIGPLVPIQWLWGTLVLWYRSRSIMMLMCYVITSMPMSINDDSIICIVTPSWPRALPQGMYFRNSCWWHFAPARVCMEVINKVCQSFLNVIDIYQNNMLFVFKTVLAAYLFQLRMKILDIMCFSLLNCLHSLSS